MNEGRVGTEGRAGVSGTNGVAPKPAAIGVPRLKRHMPPVQDMAPVGPPVVREAYLVDEEFRQPPTTTLRPIQPADIGELTGWVVPMLTPKMPRLTARNFQVWMQAALFDPNHLFIRSGNTVGCAMFLKMFYEPEGEVYEIAVVAREPAPKDTLAVYKGFEDWAKMKKARKCNIGSNLGADISPIAKLLGYDTLIQAFSKELEY